MALFPQGLSHIDPRCANAGERAVLRQLKRCLEDDYIVWHDVPLGPKARQPDFVILSPRWGVLLLEVKHWKRATLRRASRDSVTLATERGPPHRGQPAAPGARLRDEARHEREEAELVADRVAAAPAAGATPGDVAVLCRTRALMRPIEAALARRRIPLQSMNAQAFRRFDWAAAAVRLLTMHSAKGLEFPVVIVAGLQALPLRDEPIDEAVRLL